MDQLYHKLKRNIIVLWHQNFVLDTKSSGHCRVSDNLAEDKSTGQIRRQANLWTSQFVGEPIWQKNK